MLVPNPVLAQVIPSSQHYSRRSGIMTVMSGHFTLLLLTVMSASAAVRIEKAAYKGWAGSYRVTNGEIEIVAVADIGPRIMHCAFVGGQNLFKEFPEQLGKSGEKEWAPRGGHRLWVAPENVPVTYALDNGPVKVSIRGDLLELTQPVEPETGLEKQITVKMAPAGTLVEVRHSIRNTTKFAIQLAPWVLTMMAPGGMGITGFPPRGTHPEQLAPTNPLVVWAFTNFSDPRWKFTQKYLMLRQDPNNKDPEKTGLFNENTWGAYLLGNELFVKKSKADPSRTYTDMGCSYETFTNAEFLELETLGPLTSVGPGATVEHVETWSLHRGIRISAWTDEELDRVIAPLVK